MIRSFINVFGNSQIEKIKKLQSPPKKKKNKKIKYLDNNINLLINNNFNNKGIKMGLSKYHLKILKNAKFESSAKELREILNRTNPSKFKDSIINPLLKNSFLELTNPNSPKSPKQKYRLTNKFIKNKI